MSLINVVEDFFNPGVKQAQMLADSSLNGYDSLIKKDAVQAVDILIKYKKDVHEFTEDIVEHWELPRKIMERYCFNDVDELNDWLDNMK